MHQQQQRTLDALRRTQDFLDAHADSVGSLKESEGRKQLDDAVMSLAAHTDQQGAMDLAMAGQVSQQNALALDLRAKHMTPIATFSRAKLRGVPDFAALTKSGTGLQPKPLIRAARAMATAALPHADAFTRAGFPADTVAQLGAAATALEDAMTQRANAKVNRVLATKGIHVELAQGREAVAMLSAVVSKMLHGETTLLAGWRVAKRITAKVGAVRVPAVGPAPVPPAAPVTPVVALATDAVQPPVKAAA